MKRKIIKIDENLCSGCGLCVTACHEGAIGLQEGKARLLREDYCDGLGDCLPACPTGAISFEEREAPAYDEAAVRAAQAAAAADLPCGCPGTQAREISRIVPAAVAAAPSELRQWPVQIKLAPPTAPYYEGADLLLSADCCAYAYGSIHADFIRGRVTLIGCPKLDDVDYSEKLTEIIRNNNLRSVQVLRMEVPCCGGLEFAAQKALYDSGKKLPLRVTVISTDGRILD